MNAKTWGRWVTRLFQQRRFARRARSIPGRLWFEMLEDRITPVTFNWTGNGANNLWSTLSNWSVNGQTATTTPTTGDDLVFSSLAAAANRTTVDNLGGQPVFATITISAQGYVINGSLAAPQLALAGDINVGSSLGTETISIDLQLIPPVVSHQQTFTVNTGSYLLLSGHLSGSSIASDAALQTVTKAGPGTLELSNNNSAFTGAFNLTSGGGVLVASHANALGVGAVIAGAPTAGTTTVNSNSQLQLKNPANPITERLIINGTGVDGNGALVNTAGNNTWAGSVTLDSDAAIGANANTSLNIAGLVSDTGAGHSLTKRARAS